jgi:thioredoxin reductase (NADPH)
MVTVEVLVPGSVLAVPARRLRSAVAADRKFGDAILCAYLIRRSLLAGYGTGFRIVGSSFSPGTRLLREFAARHRLPHRWIDLDADPQVEHLLRWFRVAAEETPIVVWRGSEILRNPSRAELAELTGIAAPTPSDDVADLLVVGAGPAGIAAAVAGASGGLDTRVLDAGAAGGLAGSEFAEQAVRRAGQFDAWPGIPTIAVGVEPDGGYYRVQLAGDVSVPARTVVIATGARYQPLPVPALRDSGNVHYAATPWEVRECAGRPVAVVGDDNAAGWAALHLAGPSERVYLVTRRPDLRHCMSRYLADQVERAANVTVLCGADVCDAAGDPALATLLVRDNHHSRLRTLPVRELFVFAGAEPTTGWLTGTVALDGGGYVVTGRDVPAVGEGPWPALDRWPLPLETSCPGVFAAGDVRSGSVKRVAAALDEGAMAVRMAVEHLARSGGRT